MVLQFLRVPENLVRLKSTIDRDLLFEPSEAELEQYEREMEIEEQENVSLRGMQSWDALRESRQRYPTLAAATGAGILGLLADTSGPVAVQKNLRFIADTVFCEWAYVVDLDQEVLEVWAGEFTECRDVTQTRFDAFLKPEQRVRPGMVGKFGFANLPTDEEMDALDRIDEEDGTALGPGKNEGEAETVEENEPNE